MTHPNCRIGRIRFKAHRSRLPRKDKASIIKAKAAMTARLERAVGRA